MRVIYLNEAKAYQEAYPDNSGRVVIPVRNIICGFVDGGMLYAMKDPENEILTPFEVFVMFNDMSVSFIQPNHFQQENRVLQFENKTFCELKQVFNCVVAYEVNKRSGTVLFIAKESEYSGATLRLQNLALSRLVDGVPERIYEISKVVDMFEFSNLKPGEYNITVVTGSGAMSNNFVVNNSGLISSDANNMAGLEIDRYGMMQFSIDGLNSGVDIGADQYDTSFFGDTMESYAEA